MIKETDLAWFAGFIDGDGCFTIQIYRSISVVGYVEIKPLMTIKQIKREHNEWFSKAIKILDKLGVTYSKSVYKRPTYEYFDVSVVSIKSVKKLVKAILPYLTVKKQIATLMLNEFPIGRRTNYSGHNFDPQTGRFVKGGNFPRKINWNSIHKAAKFIDKVRHLNSPVSGSKGRSNMKWTGKALIDFYKNLETSQPKN